MAEQTIADEQAKFQQWYEEWLGWPENLESFAARTPESLLAYFKMRLCVTLGELA